MTSRVTNVLEQLTNNKFIAAAVLAAILGGVSLKADVSELRSRVAQVDIDRREDRASMTAVLQAVARLETSQKSSEAQLSEIRQDIRRLLERK